MKQLTLGEILKFAKKLQEKHPYRNARGELRECPIENIPIYIGDDEELNGVHGAYFLQEIDDDVLETVEESNVDYNGEGILIS